MSQELERVHTINLGKVLLSVDTHRATRAINMIKEYARRHMKVEDIKIEEDLAHQIWARGARHPPRKIRVRMSKTDEGYVLVSRFDEDAEVEIAPTKETKKIKEKVAPEQGAELKEPKAEKPAKEEAELKEPKAEKPAKEEAELKEPKAEKPAKEEA
ncbi:MAG: 50S ribosomal protein L31e, partial [Nitrosopumilaceae archaeon]|nr:50S ribosomal protein L31e [Nitrosopumilaceae archaeon]